MKSISFSDLVKYVRGDFDAIDAESVSDTLGTNDTKEIQNMLQQRASAHTFKTELTNIQQKITITPADSTAVGNISMGYFPAQDDSYEYDLIGYDDTKGYKPSTADAKSIKQNNRITYYRELTFLASMGFLKEDKAQIKELAAAELGQNTANEITSKAFSEDDQKEIIAKHHENIAKLKALKPLYDKAAEAVQGTDITVKPLLLGDNVVLDTSKIDEKTTRSLKKELKAYRFGGIDQIPLTEDMFELDMKGIVSKHIVAARSITPPGGAAVDPLEAAPAADVKHNSAVIKQMLDAAAQSQNKALDDKSRSK